MNTQTTFGTPVKEIVLVGRFGNALLTDKGFVMCDPCYLEHRIGHSQRYDHIRKSVHLKYPWTEYDYRASLEWRPFTLAGPVRVDTCYYRDTGGDGVKDFGLSVDSGCLVAVPLAWLPSDVQSLFLEGI